MGIFTEAESRIVERDDVLARTIGELAVRIDVMEDNLDPPYCDAIAEGCIPQEVNAHFDNSAPLNVLSRKIERDEKPAVIVFPTGGYTLRDTWELPFHTGVKIIGAGMSEDKGWRTFANPDQAYGGVRLQWHGGEAPMLRYQAMGAYISGLTLIGQWGEHGHEPRQWTGPKATAGLLMAKTRPQLGTGQMVCPQLSVCRCQVGVDLGGGGQANCDNSHFGLLWMRGCDTGVRLSNQNAVGHIIDHLFASRWVDTALDIDQGGELVVHMLSKMDGGTVIRLGESGDNNRVVRIGHVVIDNAVQYGDSNGERPGLIRLIDQVETAAWIRWNISIASGMVDKKARIDTIRLRGSSILRLQDFEGLDPQCIQLIAQRTDGGQKIWKPAAIVDGCRIRSGTSAELLDEDNSVGPYHFEPRTNFNYLGDVV